VASNPLQSIDYTYNIRGWLTKINDPANLGGDLFAYSLKYTSPANTSLSSARYNGNIAEIDWKTAKDGMLKRYSYQYDPLGRLKKGLYSEPTASVPENGFFNEEMSYDLNGNITALQRNTNVVSTATQIDNLTYTYTGNRLNTVTDGSQNYDGYPDVSGNPIAYDDNGNMKDHKDKGILQMDYNYLDLADYIKFDQTYVSRLFGVINNVNTRYTYRADGTKLKKVYTFGSGKTNLETYKITEYLNGFQYEVTASDDRAPQVLKFIPTAEGYYNFENNKYIYSYTDHLGNVRLSYFNNGTGAEVLTENNYYPFGLKHNPYFEIGIDTTYKYQYNGKELQEESGMYDYGWRQYMPEVGRWNGIDQLAESYQATSPFAYVLNNPINMFDPDGRLSVAFMDEIRSSPSGTVWTNNGDGFTNNWGGMMDYAGNPINYSGYNFISRALSGNGGGGGDVAGTILLDGITLTGKHNQWGQSFQNAFNALMNDWNFQQLAGERAKALMWVRNDGPIRYIGGAGDPVGIFDIGGQVISTWKPENQYIAMAVSIVGAVVLKKPGLAVTEMQAEKNLALGLGDDLFTFAKSKNFDTYRAFSTGFQEKKILNAMESYDQLHFNVTGFSKYQFSKFNPLKPLNYKNYTNWEMHTIFNNPSLLNKTTFYRKVGSEYEILSNYSPFGY
ncbi:RHS repeat domain-containing protein, partial [Chryseobacterium gossypii]|uniref:RHS repeat domain-containing protein n=1 Tax=Chryseobacterium gossypii TaxID=3231602 RepID=UPI0035265B76